MAAFTWKTFSIIEDDPFSKPVPVIIDSSFSKPAIPVGLPDILLAITAGVDPFLPDSLVAFLKFVSQVNFSVMIRIGLNSNDLLILVILESVHVSIRIAIYL